MFFVNTLAISDIIEVAAKAFHRFTVTGRCLFALRVTGEFDPVRARIIWCPVGDQC